MILDWTEDRNPEASQAVSVWCAFVPVTFSIGH
jgi:hypothetical protein